MSNLVSIDGSPDEVRGTGALIKGVSAELGAEATGVVSEINTREAGRPWGNDHFGRSFEEQPHGYFSVPEGADKPFNEVLKEELSTVGERLGRIADGITGAMNDFQLTDGTNSRHISQVAQD